jgi:hypothetical protein
MKRRCKNWKIKSTLSETTLKFWKNICTTSTKEFTTVFGSWRYGHKTLKTQLDKQQESSKKDKPNFQTSWIPKRNNSQRNWTKFKRNSTISKNTQSTQKSTSTMQRLKSLGKPLQNAKSKWNLSIVEKKCSSNRYQLTKSCKKRKWNSNLTTECGPQRLNSICKSKRLSTVHC